MMSPTRNILRRCLGTRKTRTLASPIHGDGWRARPWSLSTSFPGCFSHLSTQSAPPSRTSGKRRSSPIEQQPTHSLRQNQHRPSQVYPHRNQATHETSHRHHRLLSRVSMFNFSRIGPPTLTAHSHLRTHYPHVKVFHEDRSDIPQGVEVWRPGVCIASAT